MRRGICFAVYCSSVAPQEQEQRARRVGASVAVELVRRATARSLPIAFNKSRLKHQAYPCFAMIRAALLFERVSSFGWPRERVAVAHELVGVTYTPRDSDPPYVPHADTGGLHRGVLGRELQHLRPPEYTSRSTPAAA